MAKMVRKNGYNSYELNDAEKKEYKQLVNQERTNNASYYNDLAKTTDTLAKGINNRLSSDAYMSEKERHQLTRDIYNYQTNIKRFGSAGYDISSGLDYIDNVLSYTENKMKLYNDFDKSSIYDSTNPNAAYQTYISSLSGNKTYSKNNKSRLTMFGEVYYDSKPILLVLELNPKGRYGLHLDELKVASVYSKNNTQNFIETSNVLYVDNNKKRVSLWEQRTRLQLPVGSSNANSNNSVAQSNTVVNTNYMQNEVKNSDRNSEQIYTDSFKKWFGDWENNPENASKVVGEDGKPLIVYHGTDENFTVFDRTKGRANMDIQGMFFSPWELDAKGYGSSVGAYYLNIKNPAPEHIGYKALNKFQGQNNAGVKARDYLISLGYDGVNNGDEEYIAFEPNQIKSATDNIGTYDGSNPDIRYQQRNIDPLTLDDEQLKVYNKRGWSYSLFTKEDMKLLQEKFSELRTSKRADNVLADGSRIADVNNKIVIIGGTFEDPQVHCVLVINADNETDTDELKRGIKHETDYQKGKYQFKELLYDVQTYLGQNKVRVYAQDDFRYIRGRNKSWQRATLPSNFKNYGYTSDQQNGRRDSTETSKFESKYQFRELNTDEDILSDYFLDELLEDESGDNDESYTVSSSLSEILNKISNPRMTQTALKQREANIRRAVKSVFKDFDVAVKDNNNSVYNSINTLLSLSDEEILGDNIDINDALSDIVSAVSDSLKNTQHFDLDENSPFVALRETLKSYKNNSYYLNSEQIDFLNEADYSVQKYRNALFGYVNVRKQGQFDTAGDFETFYNDLYNDGNQGILDNPESLKSDEMPLRFLEKFKSLKEMSETGLSHEEFYGETEGVTARRIVSKILANVVEAESGTRNNPYVEKLISKLREEKDIQKKNAVQRQKNIAERNLKRVREQHQRQRENRQKNEYRNKIRKLSKSFESRLLHPTEGRYVPRKLISDTIKMLNLIDLDTGRSEKLSLHIANIHKQYTELEKNNAYYSAYDGVIESKLSNLADILGDTAIMDMSLYQLKATYESLNALDTYIRESIKMTDTKINKNSYELSSLLVQETRSVPKGHTSFIHKYVGSMLRAQTEFERFAGFKKDSTWLQMYDMLNNGQTKMLNLQMKYVQHFNELFKGKYKWLNSLWSKEDFLKLSKETVDIGLKDEDGNIVEITRGFMLSLYMHLLNDDNKRHIYGGGFTVPELKKYYKGKDAEAYGENQKLVRGMSLNLSNISKELEDANVQLENARNSLDTNKVSDLTAHIRELTEKFKETQQHVERYYSDIKIAIEDKLSSYDRQFIKASQELFEMMKSDINDTTMKLYGFEKAGVKNYFPIHTDPDYRNAEFDSIVRDISLENSGFVKERVYSSNPILLEDITFVLLNQIDKVSRYCGLTIPIKNFQKVYGKTMSGFETSVKKELSKKFSGHGQAYIENLISDLSGNKNSDTDWLSDTFDKIRRNVAPAALTLNPRVAIAQTASYVTAASEIGGQSLVKALIKGGKNNHLFSSSDRELIMKYSPLLWYRSQGYSDTELGDIKNEQHLANRVNKKLRYLTGWITAMDTATVGRLWYASQYYINYTMPNLEKGSDAYYQEVAKIFNNIVEKTQPNYSTMQRPDILRSKNAVTKFFTMFSTQRLQNFNIIYDSVMRYNRYLSDYKSGKSNITKADVHNAKVSVFRAVISQLISALTIVTTRLLTDMLLHSMNSYRDNDKELTKESVALQLAENILDSIFGNIVFGSELLNILIVGIEGKEYDGISLSGVNTLTNLIGKFISINNERKKAIEQGDKYQVDIKDIVDIATTTGQVLGLPTKNVEKIANGVRYHIEDVEKGQFFSFESGVKRTKSQDFNIAYSSFVDGNTLKTDIILNDYYQEALSKVDDEQTSNNAKNGNKKKEADRKMKNYLSSKYKKLYLIALKKNDFDEANNIRRFLHYTGYYENLSKLDDVLKDWRKELKITK